MSLSNYQFGERPLSERTSLQAQGLFVRGMKLIQKREGREGIKAAIKNRRVVGATLVGNRMDVVESRARAYKKMLVPSVERWEKLTKGGKETSNMQNALGQRAIMEPQVPGSLPHPRIPRER